MSIRETFPNLAGPDEEAKENPKAVVASQEKNKRNRLNIKERATSLGKKAFPYLAALTMFLGVAKSGESQSLAPGETNQQTEWVLYSLDGKQVKHFLSKKYRDDFADISNLIVTEKDGTKRYPNPPKKENKEQKKAIEILGKKIYRLHALTGDGVKEFESMDLVKSFMTEHRNLFNPDRITVIDESGKEVKYTDTQEWLDEKQTMPRQDSSSIDGSKTNPNINPNENPNIKQENKGDDFNIAKFMERFPEGSGDVIQINPDRTSTLYKVTRHGNNLTIKEKGKVQVIGTDNQQ